VLAKEPADRYPRAGDFAEALRSALGLASDPDALVLVDAIARRLPDALAEGSGELESFSEELAGGLEYPHYTRPAEFRGWTVPEVLLSGDHARIEEWRREQSSARTAR